MHLEGRNVLITGASGGIGEATAYECARRGAVPILVARRLSYLNDVAARIQADGGRASVIEADISDAANRRKIATFVDERHGHLDILINNAGITAHGRFDQTNPDVLRKTMDLNFFAMVELTHVLLPLMKKSQGEKVILLVSTPSGLRGVPGRFAYSASKAAGHAMMESLGIELKADNFRTIIFCPGYTRTGLRSSGLGPDGQVLAEEQAKGAATPQFQALRLCNALERSSGVVLSNFAGRVVYWMRTLCPSLLDKLMSVKLKRDF